MYRLYIVNFHICKMGLLALALFLGFNIVLLICILEVLMFKKSLKIEKISAKWFRNQSHKNCQLWYKLDKLRIYRHISSVYVNNVFSFSSWNLLLIILLIKEFAQDRYAYRLRWSYTCNPLQSFTKLECQLESENDLKIDSVFRLYSSWTMLHHLVLLTVALSIPNISTYSLSLGNGKDNRLFLTVPKHLQDKRCFQTAQMFNTDLRPLHSNKYMTACNTGHLKWNTKCEDYLEYYQLYGRQIFSREYAVYPLHKSNPSQFDDSDPQWSREEVRHLSFHNWTHPVSVRHLVQTGFYHTGDGDKVKCFCCGSTYQGWRVGDIPQAIHASISPSCPFIQRDVPLDSVISLSELPDSVRDEESSSGFLTYFAVSDSDIEDTSVITNASQAQSLPDLHSYTSAESGLGSIENTFRHSRHRSVNRGFFDSDLFTSGSERDDYMHLFSSFDFSTAMSHSTHSLGTLEVDRSFATLLGASLPESPFAPSASRHYVASSRINRQWGSFGSIPLCLSASTPVHTAGLNSFPLVQNAESGHRGVELGNMSPVLAGNGGISSLQFGFSDLNHMNSDPLFLSFSFDDQLSYLELPSEHSSPSDSLIDASPYPAVVSEGDSDLVHHFYCGVGLSSSEIGEDSVALHPDCEYFRQVTENDNAHHLARDLFDTSEVQLNVNANRFLITPITETGNSLYDGAFPFADRPATFQTSIRTSLTHPQLHISPNENIIPIQHNSSCTRPEPVHDLLHISPNERIILVQHNPSCTHPEPALDQLHISPNENIIPEQHNPSSSHPDPVHGQLYISPNERIIPVQHNPRYSCPDPAHDQLHISPNIIPVQHNPSFTHPDPVHDQLHISPNENITPVQHNPSYTNPEPAHDHLHISPNQNIIPVQHNPSCTHPEPALDQLHISPNENIIPEQHNPSSSHPDPVHGQLYISPNERIIPVQHNPSYSRPDPAHDQLHISPNIIPVQHNPSFTHPDPVHDQLHISPNENITPVQHNPSFTHPEPALDQLHISPNERIIPVQHNPSCTHPEPALDQLHISPNENIIPEQHNPSSSRPDPVHGQLHISPNERIIPVHHNPSYSRPDPAHDQLHISPNENIIPIQHSPNHTHPVPVRDLSQDEGVAIMYQRMGVEARYYRNLQSVHQWLRIEDVLELRIHYRRIPNFLLAPSEETENTVDVDLSEQVSNAIYHEGIESDVRLLFVDLTPVSATNHPMISAITKYETIKWTRDCLEISPH